MKKALSVRAYCFSLILSQRIPQGLFRLLCSCFLFIPVFVVSQPDWTWAKSVNTTQSEFVNDVAVDTGNAAVVAVGVFNSDISSFYGSNFAGAIGGGFVAKYDDAGNVLWAFRIGNNQDDACNGVAIDATGNIYVTGYFENIADFRGMSAAPVVLSAVGLRDAFIAKYNSAGLLQWVRSGGGSNNDEGKSVCVNYNTVFVTGFFNQSASFGALSTPAAFTNDNTFIVAYNSSGTEQWLGEVGSLQPGYGYDVSADSNNVFLCGVFKAASASVYHASGVLAYTLNNSVPGQDDGFLVSYSSAGVCSWANVIHSSSDDAANSLIVKGSSLYLTGSISNAATFPGFVSNPLTPAGNGKEIFLASINKTTGNTSWAITETGSNGDQEAQGICTGLNNEIYVSGYFSNSVLFGGSTTLNSSGLDDAFVSVYNSSGVFQRVYKCSSAGAERAPAIAADELSSLYVGGRYDDLFTAAALTLPDNLQFNAFLAKIACIPVINTISSAQSVCTGSVPLALNGITAGGMPPFFYLWQESPNNLAWSNAGGVNNSSSYSPAALTATTYYRRILTSSAICSEIDTSVSLMITVDQMPSVAVAGVDQTICGDSVFLDATTPSVGTGAWSIASGGGTFENVNKDTSDVNGLSYGVNNFVWTVSNGACPSSKDTVQITAYQAPDTIEAGNNFNVCSSAATLNAITPAVGSGTWSVISGGATVTSVSSPNSPVNGLTPGLNSFQWIVSNGNCAALRDTVSITVDDFPDVAVAGNDQIFCGDSATINANTAVVGTGSWSFATGNGNFNNVNASVTAVTNLMNGINTIVWTISNGSCPPSTDTMIVRAFYPPTISSAGADQSLCSYSAVLNANTAIYGTGSWISLTSAPVFSSVFSPGSSVTSLATGQNIFVWKITNGVCAPSTDTVIIQVDTLPTIADAGNDQTLCGDSATLSANVPVVGNGIWSVFSGAGNFSSASSATSTVYGMNNGANNFIWTVSNGVCPPSTDTVIIFTSTPVTVSNAGNDQTICADSALLNANIPTSGSGIWNVVTSGATLISSASPNSAVNNLSVGQNIFEWVISNGVCSDSRDTVIINVDAMPSAAVAGIDLNVCGDSALLNANAPVTGTGSWMLVSGTGNFNNAFSPVTGVNGMSNGSNSFVWTITNGVCPANSDTIIISSFAQVTVADAGTDTAVCDSSIVLNANSPSSGSATWNVISNGSSLSSSSAYNPVADLIPGQNIFEWIISNGVCPDSRDTVIVIADELPDQSSAGLDQAICGDTAALNANNPTTGSGTWTVFSGGGSATNVSSDSTAVINLTTGINTFIWTISNGVCPSSSDTVNINSFDVVSASSAGADQQICASTSTLSALTPTSGTGSWNVITAGPVLSNSNSATTGVNSLLVGQNVFQWIVSNGVCPDSWDTVIIYVDADPSVAVAGSDDSICGTTASLNANVPTVGAGTWSVIAGTAAIADSDSATTSISGLSLGNNLFAWTISNGTCPPVSDTVNIISLQQVTQSNAGADQQICSASAVLNANTPVNGAGYWNIVSAGPVLSTSTNPQASVTSLSPGANFFEWTISNGICPDSRDTIVIVVDAMPSSANAGPDIVTELSSVDLNATAPTIGTGAWNIINGEGSINSFSDPNATISGLQQGETILTWTVSNGTCPSSIDTLRIFNNELYIPQVITPNGDGLNDFFEIKAFENHGGPKFELYNRWGTQVYSAINYQNNFDGSNAQGVVLADDTYFYVIETADEKVYRGYLIIKRK